MILNCTDWKLFQIKLQFETLNVLKAGGGGGGGTREGCFDVA